MSYKKNLIPILISTFLLFACAYIVTPVVDVTPTSTAAKGWIAAVTKVDSSSTGDLLIDITIRNETGDWSAMQAVAGRPAVFTASDGQKTNCDTVFVGTGGHSLAPGFQMRGYTGGTKAEPKTQLLNVECKGVAATPGSKLSVDYSYVTGTYNYYVAAKSVNGKFELNLDEVVSGLTYPIAEPVQGLIEKSSDQISAINDCILTLTDVKRTDTGLELAWETNNPGEYPTYVHIGIPPVLGLDGILYGFYEDPTLADAPITLPSQTANWTSSVTVPQDATGFYILVSVETKQQKNFFSHVVDITDK
ncbi:MAG: hypothetical protein ABIF04_05220 [Chloroflexota bacterium]